MSSEIRYEIQFLPWLLSGANGELSFQSARDAASHGQWAARADPEGRLSWLIPAKMASV